MLTTKNKDKQINILTDGHVTSPKGFTAGGLWCGLRRKKLDLGWIYSEYPATTAGVYTLNTFQAAPVIVTKDVVNKNHLIQAVIVNSANANACTGKQGYLDAKEMQKLTAQQMDIAEELVAVSSTGVIGVPLPMEKICSGIQSINLEEAKVENFEQAILTTDTVTKHVAVELEIDGKTITIGGAAKGSGMIHPNMATMLGFITTDAVVAPDSLQHALREVTNQSFNMITVDGDSSTNDMVLVLANGAQENNILNENHPQWNVFLHALEIISKELSKKIARDGEGATKLIEVNVTGAPSKIAANQVAKAVISSNLVKSAIYGADPNWGRIVCAVGYSEQPVNPDNVSVSLGDIKVVENGLPADFSEEEGTKYLQQDTVNIFIDLKDGEHEATAWGCDLTYDYVKINASYRT